MRCNLKRGRIFAALFLVMKKFAVIRPEIQRAPDKLKGVPIDIEPRFVAADRPLAGTPKNKMHRPG
jgi:hypothetical protein